MPCFCNTTQSCWQTNKWMKQLAQRLWPASELVPGGKKRDVEKRGCCPECGPLEDTSASATSGRSTCGLVAMTSASHAEGRQFDPGQVYDLSCFWQGPRVPTAGQIKCTYRHQRACFHAAVTMQEAGKFIALPITILCASPRSSAAALWS